MDKVASLVFSVSSLAVAPFWLLLLLAPRWRFTARIIASPAIVLGPLALYAWLVLPHLPALLPVVARPELPAIAQLLGTAPGATIAWLHFLTLDLFLGRWIYLDARGRGLSSWLVTPLLLLTLLFAPLGLAGYLLALALRARARKPSSMGHRAMALLTVFSLALLAASLVLQMVDARQVLGVPTWVKPAKFAASIALTAPALAFILGQMGGDARRVRRLHLAGSVIAVVATLELLGITVQAARGVPSHFNSATPADAAVFAAMGLAITLLWLAELYIAIQAFRTSFATPIRTWGIRLGLLGTVLGGAVGGLMPRPTPAQLESLRAHRATPLIGAHAVGVPDGGPGLPVTRWSTEGGDLRVPHFFGLHALQALPLAAWLLERRRARRSPGVAVEGRADSARSIVALGVGWIGLTLLSLWQALRGQPLLAPDALTLMGLAVVLVTAVALALGKGQRAALAAVLAHVTGDGARARAVRP